MGETLVLAAELKFAIQVKQRNNGGNPALHPNLFIPSHYMHGLGHISMKAAQLQVANLGVQLLDTLRSHLPRSVWLGWGQILRFLHKHYVDRSLGEYV